MPSVSLALVLLAPSCLRFQEAAAPGGTPSPPPGSLYARDPDVGAAAILFVSGDELWTVPREGGVARRLAAATGLLIVVFLALTVATFARDEEELLYGFPAMFKVALAAPLLAIPLALGVLFCALRVWREKSWTGWGRVRYTVIALSFVAFLWFLEAMNLIGYRFG